MDIKNEIQNKWDEIKPRWGKALEGAILELVERVKASDLNKDIYTFILDAQLGHYMTLFGINNEESWRRALSENEWGPGEIQGIRGRRYGLDDFKVSWEGNDELGDISLEVHDLVSLAWENGYKDFYNEVSAAQLDLQVQALKKTMDEIKSLHCTGDFAVYSLSLSDLDDDENRIYISQTVPDELIKKIYGRSWNTIQRILPKEDIQGRLKDIKNYHLGSAKDRIISEKVLSTYVQDLMFSEEDHTAFFLDEILDTIRNSEEKNGEKHFISLFSNKGAYLLDISNGIYNTISFPREYMIRIQNLLTEICSEGYRKDEKKTMSWVPQFLSGLLHQYDEERFPPPQVCPITLYLENFREYVSPAETS